MNVKYILNYIKSQLLNQGLSVVLGYQVLVLTKLQRQNPGMTASKRWKLPVKSLFDGPAGKHGVLKASIQIGGETGKPSGSPWRSHHNGWKLGDNHC